MRPTKFVTVLGSVCLCACVCVCDCLYAVELLWAKKRTPN